jgi:hypothetical protein
MDTMLAFHRRGLGPKPDGIEDSGNSIPTNTGATPSNNKVCKTVMRRFDPGPRLQNF